jgi:hypothetical protein
MLILVRAYLGMVSSFVKIDLSLLDSLVKLSMSFPIAYVALEVLRPG